MSFLNSVSSRRGKDKRTDHFNHYQGVDGIKVMLKTILVGLLFTVTLNPASAQAQRNYIIADLGTLPGGDSAIAWGINNRGQVAGLATVPAPPPSQPPHKGKPNPFTDHAILFSNGRLRDLGDFGLYGAGAGEINGHGQIIVLANNEANSSLQSFLFTAGHIQALGSLGGALTYALGLNNFGLVVGWSSLSNGAERAFIYDGQMHDLHLGDNSEATGINDFGQIIGDIASAVGPSSAFLLTRGRMHFLPSLGGFATDARAINNFGHVVGSSWLPDNSTYHAILYIDGWTKDLGTLSGSSTGFSIANSINIEDEIVGISDPHETAFLYRRDHMVDINSLLPTNSGWVLQQANGINDLGQIVGTGTHDGLSRAFLMTPIR
jgi:probable HAF family extracellular repeat protein